MSLTEPNSEDELPLTIRRDNSCVPALKDVVYSGGPSYFWWRCRMIVVLERLSLPWHVQSMSDCYQTNLGWCAKNYGALSAVIGFTSTFVRTNKLQDLNSYQLQLSISFVEVEWEVLVYECIQNRWNRSLCHYSWKKTVPLLWNCMFETGIIPVVQYTCIIPPGFIIVF